METTQIRVRVPARRLKKVQRLLAGMGTDAPGVINMLLAQIELRGRLPFDVLGTEQPNAVTRAAIAELDGLADAPAYGSVAGLFAALNDKARK